MKTITLIQVAIILCMSLVATSYSEEDVTYLYPVQKEGKWGYIDINGKIVIEPKFDHGGGYSEGVATVEVKNKWGLI